MGWTCITSAAQDSDYSETFLCTYKKDVSGGFSHRWVAYIIDSGEGDGDKHYYIDLNGRRLGPYSNISTKFEISLDGEHIAFAAEKQNKWHIVLDGDEKWLHETLRWPWNSWIPTLEGNSIIPQTRAAALYFSSSGTKLAYPVKLENEKWAVFVNGKPGATYATIGTQIGFVRNKVHSVAWTQNGIVIVYGNRVLGPYEEKGESRFSDDGRHFGFVAKNKDNYFLVVDGREQKMIAEIGSFEIGPAGEVAYVYKSKKFWRVRFRHKQLPGEYEEVTRLTISPDGKHLAFFGKMRGKWFVVTDFETYPGYGGYYFYRSGAEEYAIMWGPESKNLAYFARGAGGAIFALNGNRRPLPEFERIAFPNFVDDKGISVGADLIPGPRIQRQAFVQSFIQEEKSVCGPLSSTLLMGKLSCIKYSDKGATVIIGKKREGPYKKMHSDLYATSDGKHYAYIISVSHGQKVVIDGRLMPPTYEAIYRPRFSSKNRFAHLGLKDGKLFRVVYRLITQK